MKQLGEILLDEGLVTEAQLLAALDETMARGSSLGRTLVELGVLTEGQLVKALAAQVGMQFVDLDDYPVDRTALSLVPAALCRRYTVLPIALEGGSIVLATADPGNVMAVDDVRSVRACRSSRSSRPTTTCMRAIDRYCRADDEMEDLTKAFEDAEAEPRRTCRKMGEIGDDDAPIVRFVNLLVTQAITDRASDIHIEPTEHDLRVRYRIDGVLHEIMRSPKQIQAGVISRVKIMARHRHRRAPRCRRTAACRSTHRRPQDRPPRRDPADGVGREDRHANPGQLDGAASTCATSASCDDELRALREAYTQAVRDHPGHRPDRLRQVDDALRDAQHPSTKPEINIITVEDPVEYQLAGINQVQVNPKAGLTFAAALRSILRSDPDVVLVGEIRDHETAQIAVEAALTGHLVLSTLHTNDAPSAVTRLIEMGIEPFLVGLGARLRRRPAARPPAVRASARSAYAPTAAGAGRGALPVERRRSRCPSCSARSAARLLARPATGAGSRCTRSCASPRRSSGSTVEHASSADIAATAIEQGMITLRDDGWHKVAHGADLHRGDPARRRLSPARARCLKSGCRTADDRLREDASGRHVRARRARRPRGGNRRERVLPGTPGGAVAAVAAVPSRAGPQPARCRAQPRRSATVLADPVAERGLARRRLRRSPRRRHAAPPPATQPGRRPPAYAAPRAAAASPARRSRTSRSPPGAAAVRPRRRAGVSRRATAARARARSRVRRRPDPPPARRARRPRAASAIGQEPQEGDLHDRRDPARDGRGSVRPTCT